MVFFLGFAVGALLNGYLSDQFGRKKSILVGCFFGMAVEFMNSYASSWQMYTVGRFLAGTFSMMVYAGGFIL